MRAGLVSITFRKLPPEDVIRLCSAAGLRSIEWGGDVHVPPGDRVRAAEIGRLTREAGLAVAAYGSYYRLGCGGGADGDFSAVLESAVELQAPSIRVWAGNRASADADPGWRQAVADDALRCADLAAEKNVCICYEFHGGTLTDSLESAVNLLEATRHPFVRTLWQPPTGSPVGANLVAIRTLAPRLAHVHVFHWGPGGWNDRKSLADGAEAWKCYCDALRDVGFAGDLLLEFVAGDEPAALAGEAAFLWKLINPET